MIKALCIFCIFILSEFIYTALTALFSYLMNHGFDNDDASIAIGGWITGGILFITVVILWATTPCPFFIK